MDWTNLGIPGIVVLVSGALFAWYHRISQATIKKLETERVQLKDQITRDSNETSTQDRIVAEGASTQQIARGSISSFGGPLSIADSTIVGRDYVINRPIKLPLWALLLVLIFSGIFGFGGGVSIIKQQVSSKMRIYETEIQSKEAEVRALQQNIKDLQLIQAKATEVPQRVETLQKTIKEQKVKLDEQNRLIQQQSQEIQTLQKTMKEQKVKLDEQNRIKEAKATEAQQQIEALQKITKEQKAKLDEQNRLIQQWNQEIQTLRSQSIPSQSSNQSQRNQATGKRATPSTGCVVTINNPLVSLKSEPQRFSRELISVRPDTYAVLAYVTSRFGRREDLWFQIESEGRRGWIVDDTWTIAAKTSECP